MTAHLPGVGSNALLGERDFDLDWTRFCFWFERREGFAPTKGDSRAESLFGYFTAGAHDQHMGRLTPKVACSICNDTGWNYGAQPGPGPGYKTIPCRCKTSNAKLSGVAAGDKQ